MQQRKRKRTKQIKGESERNKTRNERRSQSGEQGSAQNGRGSANEKLQRLCYACQCKSIVRGLPLPPQHTTLHRLQPYLTRVAPQVKTISGYAMRHICVNQRAHTAKTHIRAIDTLRNTLYRAHASGRAGTTKESERNKRERAKKW